MKHAKVGVILGIVSANERRRYYVTPSLIRRAHTQNDPCKAGTFAVLVNCIPIGSGYGLTPVGYPATFSKQCPFDIIWTLGIKLQCYCYQNIDMVCKAAFEYIILKCPPFRPTFSMSIKIYYRCRFADEHQCNQTMTFWDEHTSRISGSLCTE